MNKFLFDLMFTPNKLIGSTILEKSLFDKLLSPISLILLFPEHKPIIHLARVPEFPALIVIFLLQIHLFQPHKYTNNFFEDIPYA